jgi:hypothetical protein
MISTDLDGIQHGPSKRIVVSAIFPVKNRHLPIDNDGFTSCTVACMN